MQLCAIPFSEIKIAVKVRRQLPNASREVATRVPANLRRALAGQPVPFEMRRTTIARFNISHKLLQGNMMATPLRSFRVTDDIWYAARKRAQQEGVSVSELIVTILDAYGQNRLDIQKKPQGN